MGNAVPALEQEPQLPLLEALVRPVGQAFLKGVGRRDERDTVLRGRLLDLHLAEPYPTDHHLPARPPPVRRLNHEGARLPVEQLKLVHGRLPDEGVPGVDRHGGIVDGAALPPHAVQAGRRRNCHGAEPERLVQEGRLWQVFTQQLRQE